MKRNIVTVIVGFVLLLIFVVLLFTFQVRQTEVAVVTTFDRPTSFIEQPGLNFKWPSPIQKVYRFDKRVHNFEGRFEQTLTKDNYPLLVMLYVGWTITNPTKFFDSFPKGQVSDAEPALAGLIESFKNSVVGNHPFSHFVSTDEKELRFAEVENEILNSIKPLAESKYGIGVQFVGIKKLGLPESVTEKVFARMQAERQREVERLKAEGDAAASSIRSAADRDRDEIVAQADAKATVIRGEADAESAKSLAVFEQQPELAVLLLKLKYLEETLKDKATLILDERTPPYDLLAKPPGQTNPPAAKPSKETSSSFAKP